MSTAVYPYLSPASLKTAEELSTSREVAWLLDSLQETLASLKSGLEDCYALLSPIEPGSTLVISSHKSESIKGHVTRVGNRIVRGTLSLRLKTHPPITFSLSPTSPLLLAPLTSLRNLLNQALDCVDITRWTGDRHSALFISSQLRLLHALLTEALTLLKGPDIPDLRKMHSRPGTRASSRNGNEEGESIGRGQVLKEMVDESWTLDAPDKTHFEPALPENISLSLELHESSLLLTLRVLEPASANQNLGSRFAFAVGAMRRLEHDEMDAEFTYLNERVRVKEKVRVESSADPSLLSVMAKLGALERTIEAARIGLRIVSGEGDEKD